MDLGRWQDVISLVENIFVQMSRFDSNDFWNVAQKGQNQSKIVTTARMHSLYRNYIQLVIPIELLETEHFISVYHEIIEWMASEDENESFNIFPISVNNKLTIFMYVSSV